MSDGEPCKVIPIDSLVRRDDASRTRLASRKYQPTKVEREIARAKLEEMGASERPRTRGECAGVERPCPFVSCRHSLYLDIRDNGALQLNFPDREPDEMPADGSCALDVAEEGGVTLEHVGGLLNVTRERARQVEAIAIARLKTRQAIHRLRAELGRVRAEDRGSEDQ